MIASANRSFPPSDGRDSIRIKPISVQSKPSAEVIVINGKTYVPKQLEHFGDGVLNLAARKMCYEKYGSNQILYFLMYRNLITNKNLGGGLPGEANRVEIEIGRTYVVFGIETAIQFAKRKLQETAACKHL